MQDAEASLYNTVGTQVEAAAEWKNVQVRFTHSSERLMSAHGKRSHRPAKRSLFNQPTKLQLWAQALAPPNRCRARVVRQSGPWRGTTTERDPAILKASGTNSAPERGGSTGAWDTARAVLW